MPRHIDSEEFVNTLFFISSIDNDLFFKDQDDLRISIRRNNIHLNTNNSNNNRHQHVLQQLNLLNVIIKLH